MNLEHKSHLNDPALHDAIRQLQCVILEKYPAARVEVSEGDDPAGVYLTVTVDLEDTTDLLEAVADILFVMQVERELPIYVVPVRPVERVIEELRAQRRGLSAGRSKATLEAVFGRP